ncbi:MAG: TRAP transporter large permease subunit [Pseudomonadota bacterium]
MDDLAPLFCLLMLIPTFAILMAGYPVALSLGGSALLFSFIGLGLGFFELEFLFFMPQRVFGTMTNEILIAVPLFVFMGIMLERSKVAEELLETMGTLFGKMRGGIGISVCIVGALLAASTGIIGATVVTMGLLSLPTMLKKGYDPKLSCGVICASGTLGQIIPPSIVLVLLGDQMSNAYVDAQREAGNWSPEPVSVGDLFAGALIPGLCLIALYILYQIIIIWFRPNLVPPVEEPDPEIDRRAFLRKVVRALVPPVILIVSVLGSILGGIATPTEAAAVGAVGAVLLASFKICSGRDVAILITAVVALAVLFFLTTVFDLRITRTEIGAVDKAALWLAGLCVVILLGGLALGLVRTYQQGILKEVNQSALRVTCMIFLILIGAAMFSLVFKGFGGDTFIKEFLASLPGGVWGALALVLLVMFLLGFFLDFIEIIFVVVPIVAPALFLLDPAMSPVWLGVLFAMNLQTSFLTPPFGFALFYLRGVAPPQVTTGDIYRGVIPFIGIQVLALLILIFFPAMATWLPTQVFG